MMRAVGRGRRVRGRTRTRNGPMCGRSPGLGDPRMTQEPLRGFGAINFGLDVEVGPLNSKLRLSLSAAFAIEEEESNAEKY